MGVTPNSSKPFDHFCIESYGLGDIPLSGNLHILKSQPWNPGTDRSKPFCQVVQFISQKTHVFFFGHVKNNPTLGLFQVLTHTQHIVDISSSLSFNIIRSLPKYTRHYGHDLDLRYAVLDNSGDRT